MAPPSSSEKEVACNVLIRYSVIASELIRSQHTSRLNDREKENPGDPSKTRTMSEVGRVIQLIVNECVRVVRSRRLRAGSVRCSS